ncbi:coiled-coil domain-containing protein 18-like [Haliotis rubra]|uniref:coiled-coil domain-containing protein 18-like n=1 Tax=Haliotis rubra TaxID=36100 RepID=UPI001EE52123|nr:coiled-coil domain-containing protein 18-like [Haliotis rubra]
MESEVLEIMKIKENFDPSLYAQMELVQQRKMFVKTNYFFVNAKKQFLKSLYMDPSNWLTTEQADAELEEASSELQEVKSEIKDVKTAIQSLCESAEEGFSLLTQKQQLLEEKKQELEEKKLKLQQRQTKNSTTQLASDDTEEGSTGQEIINNLSTKIEAVEYAILKCDEAIDQVTSQLQLMQPTIKAMEQTVSLNTNRLKQITEEQKRKKSVMSQLAKRLEELVGNMESVSGLTVIPLSWCGMRVEFPRAGTDGVQLALSLEYSENNLGDLVLKSAEVNVDSIDVSEMLHEAVAHNDVPALVTKLKSRWLSHQPLLTEVSQLRLRYAIDWIQEENILRVMVGRGGSIVCTLIIPSGYPLSGEVTLTDIKGHSGTDLTDLQPAGCERGLTAWAEMLEEKFGRP